MDNCYKECSAKMEDGRFLSDFRTSNTREQYIKTMNGIVSESDYRMFLQHNADQIMDKEWDFLRTNLSCQTKCCVHQLPTRSTQSSLYDEIALYNAVKSEKIKITDKGYPVCHKLEDYRMSSTNGVKY